jgi:hypothetical protein
MWLGTWDNFYHNFLVWLEEDLYRTKADLGAVESPIPDHFVEEFFIFDIHSQNHICLVSRGRLNTASLRQDNINHQENRKLSSDLFCCCRESEKEDEKKY